MWLIRRVASWRPCLGQQHNWPNVAPSQRPCPRVDRASPHLRPRLPSCQTPTPHWHLHPRRHLGLAQQGPFSPGNTARGKEGKADWLSLEGIPASAPSPPRLSFARPHVCLLCPPPCQLSLCTPSQWATAGCAHVGCGVGPNAHWSPWGSGGMIHSTCVTVFCQITVGAGSPEIGTSRRSLFPATTTMVSDVRPGQSRWIFGGSDGGRWHRLEKGEGPEAHKMGGNWREHMPIFFSSILLRYNLHIIRGADF